MKTILHSILLMLIAGPLFAAVTETDPANVTHTGTHTFTAPTSLATGSTIGGVPIATANSGVLTTNTFLGMSGTIPVMPYSSESDNVPIILSGGVVATAGSGTFTGTAANFLQTLSPGQVVQINGTNIIVGTVSSASSFVGVSGTLSGTSTISTGTWPGTTGTYSLVDPHTTPTAMAQLWNPHITGAYLVVPGNSREGDCTVNLLTGTNTSGTNTPGWVYVAATTLNIKALDYGQAAQQTGTNGGYCYQYGLLTGPASPRNTGYPAFCYTGDFINDISLEPYTQAVTDLQFMFSVEWRDGYTLVSTIPVGFANSGTTPGMSGTTWAQNYQSGTALLASTYATMNSSGTAITVFNEGTRYNPTFLNSSGSLNTGTAAWTYSSGSVPYVSATGTYWLITGGTTEPYCGETATISTIAGSGTITISNVTGGYFVGQLVKSAHIASGTLVQAPYISSGTIGTYTIVMNGTASATTSETGSFSSVLDSAIAVHLNQFAYADKGTIMAGLLLATPLRIPVPLKDDQWLVDLSGTLVTNGTNTSTPFITYAPLSGEVLQPGATYFITSRHAYQTNGGTGYFKFQYTLNTSGSVDEQINIGVVQIITNPNLNNSPVVEQNLVPVGAAVDFIYNNLGGVFNATSTGGFGTGNGAGSYGLDVGTFITVTGTAPITLDFQYGFGSASGTDATTELNAQGNLRMIREK